MPIWSKASTSNSYILKTKKSARSSSKSPGNSHRRSSGRFNFSSRSVGLKRTRCWPTTQTSLFMVITGWFCKGRSMMRLNYCSSSNISWKLWCNQGQRSLITLITAYPWSLLGGREMMANKLDHHLAIQIYHNRKTILEAHWHLRTCSRSYQKSQRQNKKPRGRIHDFPRSTASSAIYHTIKTSSRSNRYPRMRRWAACWATTANRAILKRKDKQQQWTTSIKTTRSS
jgi:hypothetical protein